MDNLRVAAFQRRPYFDDVRRTLDHISRDLDWCDQHQVQLAIFPECFLQGYAADRETIAARAIQLEYGTDLFRQFGSYRVSFVVGLIEQRGTFFYNTAAYIDRGRVVGKYSKTHTNEPGFDAGNEFPVFIRDTWPFGINICYDANFSEPALRVVRQGARLIVFPLNNMLEPTTALRWRSTSAANLKSRAVEAGCWVISSDVVGAQGSKQSYGCTCVVRPDGAIVGQVPEETEGVVIQDLCWPWAPDHSSYGTTT
jgi:predicted amidohydrolase